MIDNILGAPAGTTVSLFLLQHKRKIGLHHVTSVRVFRGAPFDGGKRLPQLLFRVAPVPQDMVYTDPPPGFVPPPAPVIPEPKLPWEQGQTTPTPLQPQATPRNAASDDLASTVSYNVNHQADHKSLVRIHTFRAM
jgi:hypothetical protein